MFCNHCGKEIPDDSMFCMFCGNKISALTSSSSPKHNINGKGIWNEQAVKCAKSILKVQEYSYLGLIDYLEFEKFTPEQAKYGADHCDADWNEQAVKCAKSILKVQEYSYLGLIDYLEFEKFTPEQAKYGADHCDAD